MSQHGASGCFIEGSSGPIFVLLRGASVDSRGCVLVVPPFAEEMNKCRRMVTEVALGLAGRGIATVMPDLYGTGDSGGDFADASWETWLKDVIRTAQWSAGCGHPVTGILAIRLGCALAAAALSSGRLEPVVRSVLWQPVFDGDRFLTQFLRLRIAANLADHGRESAGELRSRLKAGETIEIAGYELSGRLAAGLATLATPDRLAEGFGDVSWLETQRDPGNGLAQPAQALADRTIAQGGVVRVQCVAGEPFWSSTEIVVNPNCVEGALGHLSSESPSGHRHA